MVLGLAIATTLSLAPATPASAKARTCNGVSATIIAGSAGQITGTDGADVIIGTSGADQIFGLGGADIICGGSGADQITGGDGNDTLLGGEGDDTLSWNPGDDSDVVEGQAGYDTLRVFGANASETIELGANGSRLRFTRDVALVVLDGDGLEQVSYAALGGSDTIRVNSLGGTAVSGVALALAGAAGGGDTVADSVTVFGTAGADTLTVSGDAGGLRVSGGGLTVQVSGAEATLDTLSLTPATAAGGDGVADSVVVLGTAGADTLTVAGSGTASIPTLSGLGGTVLISAAEPTLDRLVLQGGEGDDTLSAQGLAGGLIGLVLDGGAGADNLMGSAGDDMLFGGADADQLTGWLGGDYFSGGDGTDTFTDFNSGEGDVSDGS